MNYFRVQSVGLIGLQGILVEVECVQSRRLPFLQILGTSAGVAAEMRERVLAALESAGCRLPARRITVRFQPRIHGFSLENLDLAMALVILASSGKIPQDRLDGVLVSGSLGLDGRLQAVGAEFATQKTFAQRNFRGAIVPFAESAWIPSAALAHGGGFETLSEVISFLCGANFGKQRVFSGVKSELMPKTCQFSETSARLLELAAVGAHHALLLAPSSPEVEEFSNTLALLLPPIDGAGREEWQYFHRARGNIALTLDSGKRGNGKNDNPAIPKAQNLAEELLFAKNGVIYANNLVSGEAKVAQSLFQWMESGNISWNSLGHSFSEPFDANVVAWAMPCECGGRYYASCRCRALELQKYRLKLERAVSGPFDIRFCLPALAEKRELDLKLMAERVKAARCLIKSRQEVSNGALSLSESLAMKRWSSKALLLLRSLSKEAGLGSKSEAALARVALTVSDLARSEEVSEMDLLEARHYSFFA